MVKDYGAAKFTVSTVTTKVNNIIKEVLSSCRKMVSINFHHQRAIKHPSILTSVFSPTFPTKWKNWFYCVWKNFLFLAIMNPTALRKAKIVYYFDLSECNRVKCQAKLQQRDSLFLNFYLSKKIRLDVSCESSSHKISILIFSEKKWKNIQDCHLLQLW